MVAHWDAVYARRPPQELSWFQAEPAVSLELIGALGIGPDTAVVDVGGGASPLAARLLERGFRDVTVLDVSEAALEAARRPLGPRAGEVTWLVRDVRAWRPEQRYGLWHDRAALHFLVDPADREAYLEALRAAIAPGGAAVIGTFAADGPETCSGLPVVRYDAAGLAALAGPGFELVAERREEHVTPGGAVQPFTWVALRRVVHVYPCTTGCTCVPMHIADHGREEARPRTADELLREARARIGRLSPEAAHAAAREGALLVDIRSDLDRERGGVVPGSVHVPRTVLEWRLDPASEWRNLHVAGTERPVVVICDHGWSSSLAAAALVELGYRDAADVDGGFEAWAAAGLPVVPAPPPREPGELPGMGMPSTPPHPG